MSALPLSYLNSVYLFYRIFAPMLPLIAIEYGEPNQLHASASSNPFLIRISCKLLFDFKIHPSCSDGVECGDCGENKTTTVASEITVGPPHHLSTVNIYSAVLYFLLSGLTFLRYRGQSAYLLSSLCASSHLVCPHFENEI